MNEVMSNPIKDRKIQFGGVNTLFSNFLFFYLLIIIIIIIYKFISLFVFLLIYHLFFCQSLGVAMNGHQSTWFVTKATL